MRGELLLVNIVHVLDQARYLYQLGAEIVAFREVVLFGEALGVEELQLVDGQNEVEPI